MNVNQIITLARKHLGTEVRHVASMDSSARLCLSDAIQLSDNGKLDYAKVRALKSLAYSIGMMHPDYKRAAK